MAPEGTVTRPRPPGAARSCERLVIVSHRLPIAVEVVAGVASATRTVGGLASGVGAFLHARGASAPGLPSLWIGWPGPGSAARPSEEAAAQAYASHGVAPVRIEAKTHALFYDGLANRTLWPLCHSFPSYVHLEGAEWKAYEQVNATFCDAVLAAVRPGDAVWIHDFHLMLLPALLREREPDLAIAYFHHIPFPSLDILRVLPDPWAKALLTGVLGADLVGLQTHDDVRKLLRATERLLGVDSEGGAFTLGGRVAQVDAFPISVDFQGWDGCADEQRVREELALVVPLLRDVKVILSVDRLDYTKGILNRLLAFERLLEREAPWRDRVSLLVVAVPSRVGVEAYRAMRRQIEEAVGRINGQYGTLSWTPVHYHYKALDPSALAALYLRADVALVTPLRDGMNLIAKEFLAARRDEDGVLVLSDSAGAARELGEALLVNPFHVDGLADALSQALAMAPAERARRCRKMRARIARYDAQRWGREQCDRLQESRSRTDALRARNLGPHDRQRLVEAWRVAKHRLLLLDYDGTLVPFTSDPAASSPDPRLLGLLSSLGGLAGTTVVVLSGRDAQTLGTWLSGLPVALAAEHGARVRAADGTWSGSPAWPNDVRQRVLDVMQVYSDRLPGSFVELKDVSLAWHWRAADAEVGAARAGELVEALEALGVGPSTQVVVGKRVIEARPDSANKGAAARRWLGAGPWDVVLAAGDDMTDEDLFAALPQDAWSLRVGPGESRARFNVGGPAELRGLLADLTLARATAR